MIYIYICEDDPVQSNHLKKIITNSIAMHDIEVKFYSQTSRPEELLKCLKKADSTGLYFLDVDLQAEIDGIELAEKIRSYDPRGYIVFITVHDNAAPRTFQHKVEAMDYIIKDNPEEMEDRIRSCIFTAVDNYNHYLESYNQLIILKSDNMIIQINQNDVFYISPGSASRTIIIHTADSNRQFPGSLKEIFKNLGQQFCYCNRSTIVNLRNVTFYDTNLKKLYFKNDSFCEVSHRMTRKVQNRMNALKHSDIPN